MAVKKYKVSDVGGVYDARIKVDDSFDDVQDTVSVLELLGTLRKDIDDRGNHFRRIGMRNERYYHGMYGAEGVSGATDTDPIEESYNDVLVSRNYLRNMIHTWCSRILEDRPTISAYATHPEGRDVMGARLADLLIEDFVNKQKIDSKMWEAAKYVQLHGKVGLKVTWDENLGKALRLPVIDEDTMEPAFDKEGHPVFEEVGNEGDVRFDVVTMFDYVYGGADDAHEADWCMFKSYATPYKAKQQLKKHVGKIADVQTVPYDDPLGGERTGVPVEELWIRPKTITERGLFALVIGGHVAFCSDFPYNHGQLPLSEWKLDEVRGSQYCTTHVNDSIHPQRLINELERAKVETVKAAGYPKLLGLQEVIANLQEGIHSIELDDVNQVARGARYLEPPEPSELVFGQQAENIQGMYDIFGLNEVLVGKDSVKSGTSAKQIAYLSHLDGQKLAGAMRHLEPAYERSFRQGLFLAQQYIKNERMLKVAGPGGEVLMQAFTGADLFGYDIHLEPNSGMDKFRAMAGEDAKEDLQLGAASPEEVAERAQTGLGETVGSAQERQLVVAAIMQAFQGQQPQPPQVNPQVAIEVLSSAIGINPQADPMLQQMLGFYRQMAARVQQQAGATGRPNAGPPKPSQTQQTQQLSPGLTPGPR